MSNSKYKQALKDLESLRVTLWKSFDFPFNLTSEYKNIKQALEDAEKQETKNEKRN